MAYFGLSSSSSVSTLFNTTSSSYKLLQASSELTNYRSIKSAINILKSNIAGASSDEAKKGSQARLDTIMKSISSSAPTSTGSTTVAEEAKEQAKSLLSSMGIGTSVDTLA